MTAGAGPRRIAALAAVLEQEGLDALLVTHLPNIRYLTGFSGSAGLLLVRSAGAVLITDFRYAVQAPLEAPAVEVQIDRCRSGTGWGGSWDSARWTGSASSRTSSRRAMPSG